MNPKRAGLRLIACVAEISADKDAGEWKETCVGVGGGGEGSARALARRECRALECGLLVGMGPPHSCFLVR
eukprot:11020550-Alexandrium_andersonii.AAC.1